MSADGAAYGAAWDRASEMVPGSFNEDTMDIPIIGQPQVEDWFISLQVKCSCGQQFMLVGQPGSMRACKGTDGKGAGCNRVYRIDMTPVLQQNGQPGGTPIVYNADGSFACALAFGVAAK